MSADPDGRREPGVTQTLTEEVRCARIEGIEARVRRVLHYGFDSDTDREALIRQFAAEDIPWLLRGMGIEPRLSAVHEPGLCHCEFVDVGVGPGMMMPDRQCPIHGEVDVYPPSVGGTPGAEVVMYHAELYVAEAQNFETVHEFGRLLAKVPTEVMWEINSLIADLAHCLRLVHVAVPDQEITTEYGVRMNGEAVQIDDVKFATFLALDDPNITLVKRRRRLAAEATGEWQPLDGGEIVALTGLSRREVANGFRANVPLVGDGAFTRAGSTMLHASLTAVLKAHGVHEPDLERGRRCVEGWLLAPRVNSAPFDQLLPEAETQPDLMPAIKGWIREHLFELIEVYGVRTLKLSTKALLNG